MKKIAFYFLAIVCLSFLFVNCEKDVVHIEEHNHTNQLTGDNSLYVTSKQIPAISNLVSEKVGVALNKISLSKNTKVELDVDYDKILRIKDSINNYAYSFKLKHEHFSNFSNIVVKKDSLGNISLPYIIQYLPNEQFKKIYNGLNFDKFSGKIKFLSIENYITNKYKTKLANLKSDPCPDNDVDMEDGISDPNNDGDADGGGEEQDDTPCRWVTKYWCPYGGRTYHPASVCGNPLGSGPGSTTILEWVCNGGGNDSDEIQYEQRITKSIDPCDNGGGGPSNPQGNGGSIGVNTPLGDEDAAELLYQFNQVGIQLNTEQQNWVANNLNEAEKVLLFAQQNNSQQAIEWAHAQIKLNTDTEKVTLKYRPGKIDGRDDLAFTHNSDSDGLKTAYKLKDGSYLVGYQSPLNLGNEASIASTETTNDLYWYIKPPDTEEWSVFILPKVPSLAKEIEMLMKVGLVKGAKTIATYALPVDDLKVIFTGTDLNGQDANRWMAAGFLVTSIVPGSKVLKVVKQTPVNSNAFGIISRTANKTITIGVKKSGEVFEVLKNARKKAGKALGNGVDVNGKWLRGSERNAGFFPKSVADKMRGKNYKNFKEFREEFWKNVASDPRLSKEFDPIKDIPRMKKGFAPYANKTQQVGKKGKYELHHKTPINQGGNVYDVDNLFIVTPRYHKEILLPKYHYGYGY